MKSKRGKKITKGKKRRGKSLNGYSRPVPSYYYQPPNKTDDLKFYALLTLLGVGVIGGVIYFGKKLLKDTKVSKAQEDSLEPGSGASLARRLKLAIYGVGTDEDEVFAVFDQIKSKAMLKEVQDSYKLLTGGVPLGQDLEDDLDGEDMNKVLDILRRNGISSLG